MSETLKKKTKPNGPPPATVPPRIKAQPRRRQEEDEGEYDYRTDGQPEGRGLSRIYKRDARIQIVRPKWKGRRPLVFRAVPALDPNDCETFLPYRKSAEANHFTDFFRGIPAAKYVGLEKKQSFLLFDPRWLKTRGYDPRDNPYNCVYWNCKNAVSNGEAYLGRKKLNISSWIPLFNSMKKRAFNYPDRLFFMQGLIYQNDDEVMVQGGRKPLGLNDGDLMPIVELSRTGIETLTKLLNTEHPDANRAETDDYDKYFLHGDITSLTSGKFITIHSPSQSPDSLIEDAAEAEEDEEAGYEEPTEEDLSGGGRRKKGGPMEGWKAAISPDFSYISKGKKYKARRDISEHADGILSRFQWFSDILDIPSHDEICVMMAQSFRQMPKILEFGWLDHPEYWNNSEVQAILAARTSGPGAEVPGDDDDDDADDDADERPSNRNKKRRSAALDIGDEDDELEAEEDEAPKPKLKKGGKKAAKPAEEEEDEELADEEIEDELIDEDEEGEVEEDDSVAPPKPKLKPKAKSAKPALKPRKAVEEEEEEVVEEDDIPFDEEAAEAEEEVEEEAEEEVEDEEVDDDSEVEEAMQKANSRASRRSAPSLDDYEEDAETEDDSAMAKKAAKKAAPKASPKKAAGAKKPVKK